MQLFIHSKNFNSGTVDVLEQISNFTYKVWDLITYPFPNFNSGTIDVLEWISNFTEISLGM